MKKRVSLKDMGILHIMLAIYSFGSVLSKLAAKTDFLSAHFILLYMCIIMVLGIYAIAWQQIIKKMPLTTAYANKAVTVVWGIVWGVLFFNEELSVGRVIGAIIVMCGVVLFSISDKENKE